MRAAPAFLMHLLYPPKCRGCGVRFDIFRQPQPLPLCPNCLEPWAKAKAARCAICGSAVSECDCMPPLLREAGCAALVKAVAYHPNQKELPERLILRCKSVRDRDLFAFFAADVQLPLWQALARVGTEQNAVVTYIPRRRRAVAEEGVDQGYELARALGRSLELPVLKTLQNKGKTAQKTLDHAERQAQADTAIRLRKTTTDAVRGKAVVLVDDITTAGATLAAATRQLLDAGAERVVCCVVGVTANAAGGKEIP